MMIGMFVVYRQLDFIKHRDVGYNKEQVVKIFMRAESQKQYQTLKSKLLPDSGILGITGTRARMPYFHFHSFMNRIEPLVLQLGPEALKHMLIRVRPGNIPATLNFIKETWADLFPAYPFEYKFLDEEFHRRYRNIERTGALLSAFTILAAVIACLGLFGLASFMVEQRTREIGIRKVLGSSAAKTLLDNGHWSLVICH